ncbi:MAG: glycerophosphodiester phosphodiesterase family protein [Phycisphaerae bacterium]|nr:glycerophosphodiester phosphodiesterase family protein [Phycisphaerae bacterium]
MKREQWKRRGQRWIAIPLAAGGLLTCGVACLQPAGSEPAPLSPAPPQARFVIQAHRGAGNSAPENTLESFELSWAMGTVPEADVRTTKDGVLVAFHDNTLKRLVKNVPAERANLGIADLPWAEAGKLDVGAYKGEAFRGQHIPRMCDVFAAMRGRPSRWLYLDIKDVPLATLAALVRRHGVEQQVILASTKYPLICAWRELLPEGRTLHWMGGDEAELSQRLSALREEGFRGITQLQIHVRVNDPGEDDPFRPSSAFLASVGRELQAYGILFQTLPWDCDDVGVFHRLLDLGAKSFATDFPETALEAVRTYERREGR